MKISVIDKDFISYVNVGVLDKDACTHANTEIVDEDIYLDPEHCYSSTYVACKYCHEEVVGDPEGYSEYDYED